MLDIIEEYVAHTFGDSRYRRADGSTPADARVTAIREFTENENIFIFLLSTRAMGQGVNLTAADTIIIYDHDWNPQQDLHAVDRCHRIGQDRAVLILRLMTLNSTDETVCAKPRQHSRHRPALLKRIFLLSRSLSLVVQMVTVARGKRKLEASLLRSGEESPPPASAAKRVLSRLELEQLLRERPTYALTALTSDAVITVGAAASDITAKSPARKPPTSKPLAPKPLTSKATAYKPLASKPLASKPLASKPLASKPRASKPATSKAAASKPPDAESAASIRATAKPAATVESRYLDEVDSLLRRAGKIQSDRPILSRSNSEWCNDCQLGNDNALCLRPTEAPVYFFYPRDEEGALSIIFRERAKFAALLSASPPSRASCIVPYCTNGSHWHELFLCVAEKNVYHFEAFGEALQRDALLQTTFDQLLGVHGWTLKVSRLLVQNDGSACGIWLQVVRDIYLEYVASDEYGGDTFLTFLERRLLEMGVRDLAPLNGVAKRAACKANQAFILEQRAEMRGRLVQAAMDGGLNFNAAALAGFRRVDGEAAVEIDIDMLDDVIVLE